MLTVQQTADPGGRGDGRLAAADGAGVAGCDRTGQPGPQTSGGSSWSMELDCLVLISEDTFHCIYSAFGQLQGFSRKIVCVCLLTRTFLSNKVRIQMGSINTKKPTHYLA